MPHIHVQACMRALAPARRPYRLFIKQVSSAIPIGSHLSSGSRAEDVAAAFTALLDQHVEGVNDFYMERIEEGVIILHALQQHGDKIVSALPPLSDARYPPSARDHQT